jgi:hypothetical protein
LTATQADLSESDIFHHDTMLKLPFLNRTHDSHAENDFFSMTPSWHAETDVFEHAEPFFLYNNTFNPCLNQRDVPQQIPSMLKLTFLTKHTPSMLKLAF